MSLNYKDKTIYREDVKSGYKSLDAERREYMIQVRYVNILPLLSQTSMEMDGANQ